MTAIENIDHWTVPGDIDTDSIDFSWHPNPLDPPYIYHFPSQHQRSSGVTYTMLGAVEVKLVDDFVVKAVVNQTHWHIPSDIDRSTIDFSWHPDTLEPAYIYHFPTRYQASSGVTYTVPGASKIKLVNDFIVETKIDTENWNVPDNIDIKTVDFSWKPNALDDPYIYHFPSQHQSSSGVTYTVPGASEIKLLDDFQVMSKETLDHWYVPDNIDRTTVDHTWHPSPLEPAYIYHFPSQHQSASGVTYTVPGSTQTKVIDAFVVRATEDKDHWTVPDEIDAATVDFSWHPDALEPAYIYHFPSEWQASSGLEYHQPGAVEIKIADEFPHHVSYVGSTVSKVLDIFFVDHYNNQSPARWERLLSRYPHAQKIRFANSQLDTIRRCCNRTTTSRFWVVSSECIYDGFDFAWHPESWQRYMTHVFGSQWQKWSATFLINRAEFERNVKWARSLEEFPNLNFVRDQPVVVPDDLYDIYYVDHGNQESQDQLLKLREDHPNLKTTRFVDNYLDTLKRIMSSAETEYVWVISSICDYTVFDFSWQPEPWQAEMIHVFASNSEKRGDTFYIHVESFKRQMADLEILDWFNVINYTSEQWVQRYHVPTVRYDSDSIIDAIKQHDFKGDIYVKFQHVSTGDIGYTPCIWRGKDRAVHSLSNNNATALIPRDIKQYPLTQIYDYPEIDKTKRGMLLSRTLDVVFISNGETDAERWFNHLKDNIFSRYHGVIHPKRVMNVDGRTRAYQAAAEASETDWFFAVFAKLEVLNTFDWSWQPDYFQEPKHYIFHARNPVNGLEYGHMGVIAYNKRLVLETTDPGLDFTLSRPHEVVPMLSAIAHFNSDPWMTWRTAFREALKLRHYLQEFPTVETEHRLKTWCTKAAGNNAEWSLRGANDAIEYYEQVQGRLPELMNSFDWAWLQDFYQRKYS